MICPNCSRDNADEDNFCIFCGESLTEARSEESADEGPSQAETLEELSDIVHSLRLEVREIRSTLSRVGIRPADAGA